MHIPSVSASRSPRVALLVFAALISAATAGCGSSADMPAGNTHLQKAGADVRSLVASAETLTSAFVKAVGIATWDFTTPLPQGAPLATDRVLTRDERARFDDALLAAMAPAAASLLAAADFIDSATAQGNPLIQSSATGASTSALSEAECLPGELCRVRSGVVVETLLVMGGLGLMAWMGFGGAKDAFDQRNQPSIQAIQAAQGAELEAINEALGLPKDTPGTATLEKFKSLPFNDRQAAHRKIEDINADPEIGTLSATSEINGSVANASYTAVETGIKVYAKVPGMVGGGSALGLLTKARGWGDAGEVVDLALDVAGEATSGSGKPIADKATVVVATKPNTTLAVPEATHSMTKADARAILSETAAGKNLGTKTPEEVASAGSIVAGDLANKSGVATGVQAGASFVVTVPSQVYMTRLDKPKSGDKVKVPAMGPVNVLVAAEGKVPEVVTDVDATNGGSVPLANRDLATYDPQGQKPAQDAWTGDARTDVAGGDPGGKDPGSAETSGGETIWLMCRSSQFGDGTGGDYYACTLYSGSKDPFSQAFQDEANAQCKSATYEQGLSSSFFVEADPEKACVDACKSMGAKLPVNRCDTPYTSGETTGGACKGVAAGSDACWQNTCYNCCGTCEGGFVKLYDCPGGCAVSAGLCDCL